jgi:hypothetical protein
MKSTYNERANGTPQTTLFNLWFRRAFNRLYITQCYYDEWYYRFRKRNEYFVSHMDSCNRELWYQTLYENPDLAKSAGYDLKFLTILVRCQHLK